MKEKKELNRIRKLVLEGHLNSATKIQEIHMIQSPATPTLLFMPSYEIYGHVLILLGLNEEAQIQLLNCIYLIYRASSRASRTLHIIVLVLITVYAMGPSIKYVGNLKGANIFFP